MSLIFLPILSIAQNQTIKGTILDEDHRPVSSAIVYVDGEKVASSNLRGEFTFETADKTKINTINVIKNGYKMQTWATNGPNKISVLLSYAPIYIEGTVLVGKRPFPNKLVKISGEPFSAVKTNSAGKFKIKVSRNFIVKTSTIFLVDGEPVSSSQFFFSKKLNNVTINLPADKNANNEAPVLAKKTPNTPTQQQIIEDKDIEIDPILVVVVYDEDISPADSLRVNINDKEFLTDSNGEFEVYADSLNENTLAINDYKIVKTKYDYEDNYMFVYISSFDENAPPKEEMNIEYSENFQAVFNTLEAEKQILQETGVSLRKEIQKISEKLEKDNTTRSKQAALEAYLERLTSSLIENELAYEDAQFKTNQMMERMRSQINQQTSTIEQIEEEKESVEKERMLYFIIAAISLILIFIFYKNSQKLKEQRDDLKEITERLQEAKDDVIKSHEEMLSVKDIGQKFTSQLDFENHMVDLQESVNELLPASTFGIGVYNKYERRLEFRNQVSDVGLESFYSESIDDTQSLAGWCFNNEVELIINDYDTETNLYIPQTENKRDFRNKSVIYMPLIIDSKAIGVITMQALAKNQYEELNVSTLKSLASYASIAVSNYVAYKELKEKNKSIYDSMRYAKTIQNAILPSNKFIKKSFSDSFLLYRSKELVSGDFYWYKEKEVEGKLRKLIAVVDCTGHGVPGAFMSMIGNALLNDITNTKKRLSTVEILDSLNVGVQDSLRQEESLNDDGMDLALVSVVENDDKTIDVEFTGAKRPIYIFKQQSKELEVVNGDSKSIGYTTRKVKNFTSKKLTLEKGDIIYLSSDGYVDQNNLDRRKIGTNRLKSIILDNAALPLDQQKEKLEIALDDHQKGGVEQRDDITIMGVKL
ncbi:SpoIIE family protein phosphatase [Flammeovirga yaeyamensis]|uniref:SpoIIE family protein phosphatase n=1 Tax=Flammeovirga yaeyamensis TaxID=367791 RepID=A0AAX1N8U1_9BACT|nr:SpoIIE family protein phosphatase [Flammeovirga yaeyamensis]MBB3698722.1 serine phosphatase RsbU (regulator of sigma subunit) [Flammeovirga yaeyamensis]NMF37308.1 SpoIIE family protein phosphatase [Flammeovirga yaeyamensis]QWG03874.1 SpoIIE family protein phosphatase [Flammeovirga yaeyamensis]